VLAGVAGAELVGVAVVALAALVAPSAPPEDPPAPATETRSVGRGPGTTPWLLELSISCW